MSELEVRRRVGKFAGHLIIGGIGSGVRASIDARRDLTPVQKDVAKAVVSICQGIGHMWLEGQP